MAISLKSLPEEEFVAPGRGGCAGCPAVLGARMASKVLGKNTIQVTSTGCMCVNYGYYAATRFPFVHTLFENAGSIISGIDAALKARGEREGINLFAYCGDGGTVDIGLQALSGAVERGHRFLYICYDNEGYMNTGTQRSGATPPGARTSTTPVSEISPGEGRPFRRKKDMVRIMAAHGIPYAASASLAYPLDYLRKIKKAIAIDGPTFIHLQSPCLNGWGLAESQGVAVARLAVETCVFPLYEVEEGRVLNINVKPREKKPVTEYLQVQGRFRHLFTPRWQGEIAKFQAEVDRNWEMLLALEQATGSRGNQ
ncbi:MAG: pyruvate ferredoxin oxidoreductase beta subunit [Clostridia bacterium]|nr:pyruvate ferredoxin oxidoreductase beta subunit [Clostridia bacterium]